MKGYAIEHDSSPGGLDRMAALWGKGLDYDDRGRGKLDWYYRGNPEGTPLVTFLLHENPSEAVGVAATGTRSLRCGDRRIRAGTMVDFVVAEEHRTLFPAMELQKAICRRALESHDLLYGIPNPHSLAAVQRAGYRRVGAMVRRVRVLRAAPYLNRHLPAGPSRLLGAVADRIRLAGLMLRRLGAPGYRPGWLDRPDDRFDDLWNRAADGTTLLGVRDRRFLLWRFHDFPRRRHRFYVLDSERDGRLAAYAVCDPSGPVLHVRDFLVDPAQPRAWASLWSNLPIAAWRAGHDSLALEFMGSARIQRRLARAGLVARERQPVYAVLPAAMAEFAEESRWYLTNADDDT